MHYKVNQRTDSQFWIDCRNMAVPDSLAHKIELFKSSGKVFRESEELFAEVAWQQVLIGQGVIPDDYHPIANSINDEQLTGMIRDLRSLIGSAVAKLPSHEQFLAASNNTGYFRDPH